MVTTALICWLVQSGVVAGAELDVELLGLAVWLWVVGAEEEIEGVGVDVWLGPACGEPDERPANSHHTSATTSSTANSTRIRRTQ